MDLVEEEKTIGGVISIRQAVYMLGAVVWAVLFYFVLRVIGIYPWLCLMLALIMSFLGVLLAFGKITDMPVDRYICSWILYRLRDKFFYFGGDG
jgi:hypothetical protein